VAVALLLIRKYGADRDVLGVDAGRLPQHALLAGQAFCMVVPPVLAMQWLLTTWRPYEHDTINQLQDHFSLATVMVTWLGAVIAAPVCEELLFRGVLQGWLQRIRFGLAANNTAAELLGGWNRTEDDPRPVTASPGETESGKAGLSSTGYDAGRPASVTSNSPTMPVQHLKWWMPIVISSLMFAAIHIGQGLAPIPLFFFGLSLGILYRFSGSVLPSILLHLMLNGFSMFWVTLESIVSHNQ
jgi:membrane protease YdiL (CAAX protease family)